MPKEEKQAHDHCSDYMELNNDDLSSVTGGVKFIGDHPQLSKQLHDEHAQKHGGIAQEERPSFKVERYGFLWRKKADVISQKVTYNDGTSKTTFRREKHL